MTTSTAIASPKAATMAAIRAALPTFFNADISGLVAGLSRADARVGTLAHALTGAAIERAQSGNMPKAWATVDTVALSLKGAVKARVANALAHVLAVKPASVKAADTDVYAQFAADTLAAILAVLTPAPAVKAAAKPTDWKAECLKAQGERDALIEELAAVRKALAATSKAHAIA